MAMIFFVFLFLRNLSAITFIFIYYNLLWKMIRIKPVVTKPSKTVQKKKVKSVNEENIKPAGFNTKGYFDPSEPFN